jgi:hypothetical protein
VALSALLLGEREEEDKREKAVVPDHVAAGLQTRRETGYRNGGGQGW